MFNRLERNRLDCNIAFFSDVKKFDYLQLDFSATSFSRFALMQSSRLRSSLYMKRKIIGFEQDENDDWRAKLECRHFQHVRHNPPLMRREWVLSVESRREKIGAMLHCKKCDEGKPADF
jgi:hypothetical protein